MNSIIAGLGDMSIPVFVYGFALCVMGVSAFRCVNSQMNYSVILFGAILFIFSDSIIAFREFKLQWDMSLPIFQVLIMVLYIFGQFFIVNGVVKMSLAK